MLPVTCGLCGGVKGQLEDPLEHGTRVDASAPEADRFWKRSTVAALSLNGVVTVAALSTWFGDHRGECTF